MANYKTLCFANRNHATGLQYLKPNIMTYVFEVRYLISTNDLPNFEPQVIQSCRFKQVLQVRPKIP